MTRNNDTEVIDFVGRTTAVADCCWIPRGDEARFIIPTDAVAGD